MDMRELELLVPTLFGLEGLCAEELRRLEVPLESGVFGADMQIDHVNDGPVTIIMDTDQMMKKK